MVHQKATAICIYEILKKYTDENHVLSADKIREKLKIIYDVDMERRAIYRNIEALRSVGIEIEGYQENREGYCLVDREYELSEIRLLSDAVAASNIIKAEKGKEIIKKLIDTQSIFQGRILQKTVFVKQEEKIWNKQLFYNIDALNIAISQGCKVSAKELEYGLDGELRQKGRMPVVFSPYVTLWAEGHYYILMQREDGEEIEHRRVDLLKDITVLERGVDMIFGGINPGQYAEHYIYRKGERSERFEVNCDQALWQDLAEQFGTDAVVTLNNSPSIVVKVTTVPAKMRSWVLNNLTQCEVLNPKWFRDEIQKTVRDAYRMYWQ